MRKQLARVQAAVVSEHDGAILGLALPALLALVLDPIMSVVDTSIVGHLGTSQLAGVGVASILFTFASVLFGFLASATTPLVAESVALSDFRAASRTVVHGLWIAISVGTLLASILAISHPLLLHAFGASPAVFPHAAAYFVARAPALPALLSQLVCLGAFRGRRDTITPMAVALITNVTNLSLDLILIFVFGLGTAGAAGATTAAQWVGCTILLWVLIYREWLRLDDLKTEPTIAEAQPLLEAGAALSLRSMSGITSVLTATTNIAKLGAIALAAHEILRQIWTFGIIMTESLSIAGQGLIASSLGASDGERARDIMRRLLVLASVLGATIAVIMCVLRRPLATLFTGDPSVATIAALTLPVLAIFQPMEAVMTVMDGVLIGARDTSYVARSMVVGAGLCLSCLALTTKASAKLMDPAIAAIRSYGITTPSDAAWLGLAGIWLTLKVMSITRTIFAALRLASSKSPIQNTDNLPERQRKRRVSPSKSTSTSASDVSSNAGAGSSPATSQLGFLRPFQRRSRQQQQQPSGTAEASSDSGRGYAGSEQPQPTHSISPLPR